MLAMREMFPRRVRPAPAHAHTREGADQARRHEAQTQRRQGQQDQT